MTWISLEHGTGNSFTTTWKGSILCEKKFLDKLLVNCSQLLSINEVFRLELEYLWLCPPLSVKP